jgi:hypothetical protein
MGPGLLVQEDNCTSPEQLHTDRHVSTPHCNYKPHTAGQDYQLTRKDREQIENSGAVTKVPRIQRR